MKKNFATCSTVRTVLSANIIDRETRRPKGFGTVEMEDDNEQRLQSANYHRLRSQSSCQRGHCKAPPELRPLLIDCCRYRSLEAPFFYLPTLFQEGDLQMQLLTGQRIGRTGRREGEKLD